MTEKNKNKILFTLATVCLFMICFALVNIAQAQSSGGSGTINQLQQFTSTTTPTSAITQSIYGKSIKITGLTNGQNLCLDANGLVTTTGCSGGGGGSTAAPAFTPTAWGASTSTTLGLYNGLFSNASSTFSSSLFLTSLPQGSLYTGSNGRVGTTATTSVTCSGSASCTSFTVFGNSPITISASGGGSSFAYPFSTFPNYFATSTTGGFLNGLFSNASSTFNGTIHFPYSIGGLAVDSAGSVYTAATTTAGTGLTYTNNSFNVNTTQNITTLSNLSTAGTVNNTSSGILYSTGTSTPTVSAPLGYTGTLGSFIGGISGAFTCSTCTIGTFDPFTHPAAGQSATTSLMLLYGNASSTGLSANYGYFDYFNATSTFATSTIINALQIGSIAGNNMLKITSPATSSASVTTGGVVNITQPFDGAAVVVTKAGDASDTGRTFVVNQIGTLDSQDVVFFTGSSPSQTVLNVQSFATGKGGIKIEKKKTAGDANASALSIDIGSGGGGTAAQGIRIDATNGGTTGNLFTALNNGSNFFNIGPTGNVGISSSTPGSLLSIGNVGGINFFPAATSTFSSSANGINITNGCFAIRGVCVSGSGGSGVTSVTGLYPILSTGGATPVISTAFGTTTNIGIGNDLFLYTSHTGVPIGVASSSLSLPNAALQNSTISGVALGGTLNALTATNGTLTFSGSYDGTNARTVGLNLGNANTWTALQQFNGSASSTNLSANFAEFGGTATTTFTSAGLVGVGTTTPFAQLSVNNIAGTPAFVIGSSTATSFIVDKNGNVGIGTTSPSSINANGHLVVAGPNSQDINCYTTNVTTSSDCIFNAYSDTSRIFMGAHGSAQVTSQYGTVVGGYSELGAINGFAGNTKGLLLGTRTTNTPIIIGTGSTERMRIMGNGFIGVGTSTPLATFHINSIAAGTSTLVAQGTTTQTAAILDIWDNKFNSVFDAFNSGLVGVGTSTPSNIAPLTIATTGPQVSLSAGAGLAQWVFANEGGSLFLSTTTVAGNATSSIPAIAFTGGQILIPDGAPTAPSIAFLDDPNNGIGSPANDIFSIYTNGLERFRINDGSGASAFGTSTMNQYLLTLGSSTAPQLSLSAGPGLAQWTFANEGGNLYFSTTTVAGTATSSTAAVSFNGSAPPSIVISTSSPFATLSVNPLAGNFAAQFAVGSSTGTAFYIDNSSHVFAPNTTTNGLAQTGTWCYDAKGQFVRDTAVCAVSDARAKNIDGLFTSGLSEIEQLDIIRYHYKPEFNGDFQSDPNFNGEQLGLTAQNAFAVNPDLASVYSDDGKNDAFSFKKGEPSGLKTNALAALALEGVKELNNKVNDLSIGKVQRSVEENWQDILIGLLILYVIYNEYQKRK